MIAVCLKWVATRPVVDPLTGGVDVDPRSAGLSEADRAALEWALRNGEAWGEEVIAVTLGPPEAGSVLREALATGVQRAVRIDSLSDLPSDTTAAALAAHVREARVVWCGDISLDRGSGSVPAFLAAHLGAEQATGLIAADVAGDCVLAVRRLDGGRRERLRVRPTAVLSVEGATARLRRASLTGEIAARRAPITVVPGPVHKPVVEAVTRPFRPRARVLAPPAGATARERIAALTAVGTSSAGRVDPVHLSPGDAADRLLAALADWGYRRRS